MFNDRRKRMRGECHGALRLVYVQMKNDEVSR